MMNNKVSKYTFLFEGNGGFYAYNSLSNSLIEIDESVYDKLSKAKKELADILPDDFDLDLFDVLTKNIIITESEKDDYLTYKSNIYSLRNSDKGMHITIAPTMECCFNCHYCFEKNKTKGKMSSEVMDRIVKYVETKENLKAIHITWFGGEPLMATEQIELFYDKIKPIIVDKDYQSNIVTTAYFVNENTVRVFKKIGITDIQVTVDGMKDTHNKIKNFEGAGDVFEKIMQNIEYLNDNLPEVQIAIRVNLTKDNAHEYPLLVDMLKARFINRKNIFAVPAFVLDKGENSCHGQCNNSLFNPSEKTKYILELYNKGYGSHFVRYPEMFFYECAVRNKMAVSFDPEGYVYKCWEMLGNRDYSIGRLDSDGKLVDINTKAYNRQMYGADPLESNTCRQCKYLPICNGGCPIHRIQNEFEGDNNSCCTHYKGYMEEFLKIHIACKKQERKNAEKNQNCLKR